jgi:predicted Zn-dependent protease
MNLKAAAALAQAGEKSGDSASARYIQGLLALREERAEDALNALTPLSEAAPDATDVRLDAGRAFALAGQWSSAQRAFNAAATQASSPVAPLAAARVWITAGRADLAAAAAEDAERRARALAVVLATRAEAIAMEGGSGSAARDAVNEALRLAPNLPLANRVAGQLALANGQTEVAFKFLRRAVDLESYSAESLYALGRAQLSTRELQSAGRATLARAHRLDANGRFGRLAARALGQ